MCCLLVGLANLPVVLDAALCALFSDVQTDRHLEPFYGSI